jgi:hypothetical protein
MRSCSLWYRNIDRKMQKWLDIFFGNLVKKMESDQTASRILEKSK